MEITPAIKSEFLSFDSDQVVSELIGQLRKYDERHGLIFKKDKYLGVIEKKRLLRSRLDVSKAKIQNFVHHTPLVNEHADVIETAYALFQADSDFVPVESNKKIVGVLTALDLAQLAAELPETKSFTVADVKLVKGEKLEKDAPVGKAIDLMHKARVDQVPIFEGKKLYGIVSFRDVLQKYLAWVPRRETSTKFDKVRGGSKGAESDKPNLAMLPIKSFSTNQNIVTVPKDSKLSDAVALMTKNNVSSAIVMDGEKFEGLLTLKNILRLVSSLQIPENFNIRFVGLNEVGLLAYQKEAVQKIASNEAFKLQREIQDQFSMVVHIKEYSKGDRERKYSVALHLDAPGQNLNVTQYDWRIETALHKTFDNAKNALKRKLKMEKSRRREF
ncbi:MAG: CBS domain-containing protein [Nanoarchaeota archaeon]